MFLSWDLVCWLLVGQDLTWDWTYNAFHRGVRCDRVAEIRAARRCCLCEVLVKLQEPRCQRERETSDSLSLSLSLSPSPSVVTSVGLKALLACLCSVPSRSRPPPPPSHIHLPHRAEHRPMLLATPALGVRPMRGKHSKIEGFTWGTPKERRIGGNRFTPFFKLQDFWRLPSGTRALISAVISAHTVLTRR